MSDYIAGVLTTAFLLQVIGFGSLTVSIGRLIKRSRDMRGELVMLRTSLRALPFSDETNGEAGDSK